MAEQPKHMDFLLTVKVPIKCFDSVDARILANHFLGHILSYEQIPTLDILTDDIKVKLQQIFPDKEPTGIQL